jgi:hypothetical protein
MRVNRVIRELTTLWQHLPKHIHTANTTTYTLLFQTQKYFQHINHNKNELLLLPQVTTQNKLSCPEIEIQVKNGSGNLASMTPSNTDNYVV